MTMRMIHSQDKVILSFGDARLYDEPTGTRKFGRLAVYGPAANRTPRRWWRQRPHFEDLS